MENTRFIPEKYEHYYSIEEDLSGKFCIGERMNLDLTINEMQISQGNCFRNRDEAEEKLKEILEILKK